MSEPAPGYSDLPENWQEIDAIACYELAIKIIGERWRAGATIPDCLLSEKVSGSRPARCSRGLVRPRPG